MELTKEEKIIFQNLRKLGLSDEEIFQTISDDREINRNKDLFPLTEEQKKNSKAARIAGTRKVTAPHKPNRKEDTAKRFLINQILKMLEAETEISEIEKTNPERQIDFIFQNRKFRIVLSAPRS